MTGWGTYLVCGVNLPSYLVTIHNFPKGEKNLKGGKSCFLLSFYCTLSFKFFLNQLISLRHIKTFEMLFFFTATVTSSDKSIKPLYSRKTQKFYYGKSSYSPTKHSYSMQTNQVILSFTYEFINLTSIAQFWKMLDKLVL